VAVGAGGGDVAGEELHEVAAVAGAFPGAEKVRWGGDPGDARGLERVEARPRRPGRRGVVDERVVVDDGPWWVRGGGGGGGEAKKATVESGTARSATDPL
jgi:hypothetical protein